MQRHIEPVAMGGVESSTPTVFWQDWEVTPSETVRLSSTGEEQRVPMFT